MSDDLNLWQEELDAFDGKIVQLAEAVAEQQANFERRFAEAAVFPRTYNVQVPDLVAPIPSLDFVHIAPIPAHPAFGEAEPVLTTEPLGPVEMSNFQYRYDLDANEAFLATHRANFALMAAWIADLRGVHEQSSADWVLAGGEA
ncbi:hypothetical protein [Rhizorhabdus wittichii]|uniref:hypothetical protein n=1 Tax=Rhizorhabdus wittichii TaxID=160791 RepID=UPI0002E2E2F9|nr:hypothetical protein [Rhizorhabdus wittichii]